MVTTKDWTAARAASAAFAITYWAAYQPRGPRSSGIFENFSTEVREIGIAAGHAVPWPFDIRELFSDRSHVLHARLKGVTSTKFRPIPLSSLRAIVGTRVAPFNVVLSSAASAAEVSEILQQVGPNWLHISTVPSRNVIGLNQVNENVFLDYFRRVAAARASTPYGQMYKEFLLATPREWSDLSAERPRTETEQARANEDALEALGISFHSREATKGDEPTQSEIDAEAMAAMRDKVLGDFGLARHADDLSLCVESVGWGLSREAFRHSAIVGIQPSRQEADAIYGCSLSRGYSSEFEERALSGGIASALAAARDAERSALNSALLLHSGTRLTPVLRLPPEMNRFRPSLLEIGQCARGNGPHRDFKLNKLGRRLGEGMGAMIDARALSEICGSGKRIGEISLISDLPLEWLLIDDVPLGMRHDVSRIPFTPGGALMGQCANSEISYISDQSLSEVLVVRSFRKDDPIAGYLEKALGMDLGTPEAPTAKIKFVDVETPAEFVTAVSEFQGSLLIFDGHGSRDVYTGVGSIIVGGQPLDIWNVRDKLRFPPIVLLSACDTFPIDGSHGSAAAGMLALGARTVLGTLLPIHSLRSCMFIARLIWRLAGLLPIEMKRNPLGVNWRFMMSGMLRMVYASELIYSFTLANRLSRVQRSQLQYEANTDINYRNPDWYARLQARLASAAKVPLDTVKAYCRGDSWITDSMKYVQLGRPELVHVIQPGPLSQRN